MAGAWCEDAQKEDGSVKMPERSRENVMGGVILLILLVFACLRIWAGVPPEVLLPGGGAALAVVIAESRLREEKTTMKPLELTPLSTAHLTGLERLWSDPTVIRYTNVAEPCSADAAAHRFYQLRSCQAALPGPTIFAVLRNGRFCGVAGCPPVDAERGIFGLFYQLLPEVWGQGVGRDAARLALEELYSLIPTATVYADVAAANTASVRILEELGFMRTAVHPGAFRRDGEVSDIWDYTLEPAVEKEEHL